jgi:Lanthionine-containing peptide SapB precursor RamS
MALLDLQTMETAQEENHGGGHEGGNSSVSLLLCDSFASVALCL